MLVQKIRQELRVVAAALMFFTRLPVPPFHFVPELLNRILRYASLIGMIVGIITAAIYLAAYTLFESTAVAATLCIIAAMLTTGAFHEDGFADYCDGLATRGTPATIVQVMRNSTLGRAGFLGLSVLLTFRIAALALIDPAYVPAILIFAHSASRYTSATITLSVAPVEAASADRQKPAVGGLGYIDLLVCGVLGYAPAILFDEFFLAWIVPMLLIVRMLMARLMDWKPGGYTGDTLGATQAVAETIVYVSALVLIRAI